MDAPSLSQLVLRWQEERRQGRTPSAKELCAGRPEFLPELERQIRALESMQGFLGGLFSEVGPEPETAEILPLPAVPGYEVRRVLGRGGMGVVYEARHRNLDRTVALKMVLAGSCAGPAERARFRAEAKALACLQHPHVVQIFDVGEFQGLPFLALEYVEGGSLADRLHGQPLPPREAVRLVEQVARGVQAVHEKGVVHRDLKPGNVLLTADGMPKVADFGLAKRLDASEGLSATGDTLGTPSYMPPEQAAGRTHEAGAVADVYALGAILYECLTGRPPFHGRTRAETLQHVLHEEPQPPRCLNPKTPRDLETVCLKCLEKRPESRYATAQDLADDLRRFLHSEPVLARRVTAVRRAVRWVCQRAALTLLSLALTASLIGLAYAVLLPRAPDAQHNETSTPLPIEPALQERYDSAVRGYETARDGRIVPHDSATAWAWVTGSSGIISSIPNGLIAWVVCEYQGYPSNRSKQGNPTLVVLGNDGTLDAWTGSSWQRIGVADTQLYSGFSDLIGQPSYIPKANFVVRNGSRLLAWDGTKLVEAPSGVSAWAVCDYQGRASVAVLGTDGTAAVWAEDHGWLRLGIPNSQTYSGFSNLIGSHNFTSGATFLVCHGSRLFFWRVSDIQDAGIQWHSLATLALW
jgi:predicted Ser/Thr protein kinase